LIRLTDGDRKGRWNTTDLTETHGHG
jgi:hypothetical protein